MRSNINKGRRLRRRRGSHGRLNSKGGVMIPKPRSVTLLKQKRITYVLERLSVIERPWGHGHCHNQKKVEEEKRLAWETEQQRRRDDPKT
jgi:hypothetical protein